MYYKFLEGCIVFMQFIKVENSVNYELLDEKQRILRTVEECLELQRGQDG